MQVTAGSLPCFWLIQCAVWGCGWLDSCGGLCIELTDKRSALRGPPRDTAFLRIPLLRLAGWFWPCPWIESGPSLFVSCSAVQDRGRRPHRTGRLKKYDIEKNNTPALDLACVGTVAGNTRTDRAVDRHRTEGTSIRLTRYCTARQRSLRTTISSRRRAAARHGWRTAARLLLAT